MDHSMLNVLEDPELGLIEIAYMVGKHHIDARTFAVYVPKLMPLIGLGGSKSSGKLSINKSIFANSSGNEPSVSTTVGTQNFITVSLYPNRSTSQSSNRNVKLSEIGPGNKMILHLLDYDIQSRFLDEVL